MVTPSNPHDDTAKAGGNVKDSAQQIWLAGLGAFAKAQEEGSKVFEALVKEGLGMQRKSQAAAEEKIAEATTRMSSLASGLAGKTTGPWDKLENIFEDRVAKALKKLGVPSAKDIEALMARLETLNTSVQLLASQNAAARTTAPAQPKAAVVSAKPVSAKPTPAKTAPAAKRAASRKTAPAKKS